MALSLPDHIEEGEDESNGSRYHRANCNLKHRLVVDLLQSTPEDRITHNEEPISEARRQRHAAESKHGWTEAEIAVKQDDQESLVKGWMCLWYTRCE